MLEFKENLPVVLPITAPILFVANAALSRQIGTQLSILGVKTVITNVKDASVRTALGVLAGLGVVIFNNPPAFIGGGLVLVAFGLNVQFGGIKCENFVHKLPVIQARLTSGKSPYLDLPPGQTNLIVMPETSDEQEKAIEVYVEESTDLEKCSVQVESSGSVKRNCYTKKKYVPLDQRTKTLADLKREDSTEVREQAVPDINRYKKKTQRLREKRIRENKISNSDKKEL